MAPSDRSRRAASSRAWWRVARFSALMRSAPDGRAASISSPPSSGSASAGGDGEAVGGSGGVAAGGRGRVVATSGGYDAISSGGIVDRWSAVRHPSWPGRTDDGRGHGPRTIRSARPTTCAVIDRSRRPAELPRPTMLPTPTKPRRPTPPVNLRYVPDMTPRSSLRPLDVVIRIAIVGLTLGTAYIHSTLGGLLFTLNALGYLVAAVAVVIPLGLAIRFRWFIRLGLMGYAATAIVAWAVQGPYYSTAFIAKGIEVVLITLLAVDFARMDGNPIHVVKSELALLATKLGRRPATGQAGA